MVRGANVGTRRERLTALACAIAAAAFVAGTYVAPLAQDAGRWWGSWLRLAYAPLCHQMPERSLWIGAHPQAVCARCAGLYLGGIAGLFVAVGVFVGRRRRLAPAWLLATALPSLADLALGWLGLPHLTNVWRLAVALPPGFVAGLFLGIGLGDLVSPAARTPPSPSRITLHPREKVNG